MNNKKIIYSLSFFIPIVIIFVCWFVLKVPPFGDNVFLFGDDEIEYMNFYFLNKEFSSEKLISVPFVVAYALSADLVIKSLLVWNNTICVSLKL